MKATWIALLAGGVLMHSFAFADVSYQETTQVTGGSMMGMLKMAGALSSQARQATAPVTSTVMIHGGRMVRSNPHTTEIIDLDQQTITFIDHDKRTYSVVTFQQMQQQMAKMPAAKTKGAKTSSADGSQMSFDAHISSNGATRQLDGQTARESLLTITMTANSSDKQPEGRNGRNQRNVADSGRARPGRDAAASMNAWPKELAVDLDSVGNVVSSGCPARGSASAGGAEEGIRQDERSSGASSDAGRYDRRRPAAGGAFRGASCAQSQKAGSTAGSVTQEVAAGTATQEAGSQISRLGTFGRALSSSSMGALMHHAPSTASTPAPAAGGSGVRCSQRRSASGKPDGAVRLFRRGCRYQWFPDTRRI